MLFFSWACAENTHANAWFVDQKRYGIRDRKKNDSEKMSLWKAKAKNVVIANEN